EVGGRGGAVPDALRAGGPRAREGGRCRGGGGDPRAACRARVHVRGAEGGLRGGAEGGAGVLRRGFKDRDEAGGDGEGDRQALRGGGEGAEGRGAGAGGHSRGDGERVSQPGGGGEEEGTHHHVAHRHRAAAGAGPDPARADERAAGQPAVPVRGVEEEPAGGGQDDRGGGVPGGGEALLRVAGRRAPVGAPGVPGGERQGGEGRGGAAEAGAAGEGQRLPGDARGGGRVRLLQDAVEAAVRAGEQPGLHRGGAPRHPGAAGAGGPEAVGAGGREARAAGRLLRPAQP